MLKVGLTGGIGSGKSTVARRLAELGARVVDADAIAREVVAPGSPGLAAVVEAFGGDVLTADGSLDRAALAGRVFGDDDARSRLEAITHPLIAERTAELVAQAGDDAIVVHDVPLLVEKRMGAGYHLVVVVEAPVADRLQRLARTRGMSEADARARMDHQASDDDRRAAADVVLVNDGTPEALIAKVDALFDDRLHPFADHIAAGRTYRRPGTPVLSDYDERWAQEADRLTDRIGAALGERAPEIEHVGSTAVPGMPGKDVVDLQVGVRSLADADAPEFVAAMAAAGFPRVEDYRMDHPAGDLDDPSLWVKRFHGSCDPGRVAHVHVREVESPGWQYALLFRDWLRAEPDAADEYVALKARLADEHAEPGAYAAAKEPWFEAAFPRMQAFARRTGWHD